MATTRTIKEKTPAIPNGTPLVRQLGDPLPERIPNHPLAPALGAFENDPLWEELIEEVRKIRERHALEDAAELDAAEEDAA